MPQLEYSQAYGNLFQGCLGFAIAEWGQEHSANPYLTQTQLPPQNSGAVQCGDQGNAIAVTAKRHAVSATPRAKCAP